MVLKWQLFCIFFFLCNLSFGQLSVIVDTRPVLNGVYLNKEIKKLLNNQTAGQLNGALPFQFMWRPFGAIVNTLDLIFPSTFIYCHCVPISIFNDCRWQFEIICYQDLHTEGSARKLRQTAYLAQTRYPWPWPFSIFLPCRWWWLEINKTFKVHVTDYQALFYKGEGENKLQFPIQHRQESKSYLVGFPFVCSLVLEINSTKIWNNDGHRQGNHQYTTEWTQAPHNFARCCLRNHITISKQRNKQANKQN